jgi:hypothetical protein
LKSVLLFSNWSTKKKVFFLCVLIIWNEKSIDSGFNQEFNLIFLQNKSFDFNFLFFFLVYSETKQEKKKKKNHPCLASFSLPGKWGYKGAIWCDALSSRYLPLLIEQLSSVYKLTCTSCIDCDYWWLGLNCIILTRFYLFVHHPLNYWLIIRTWWYWYCLLNTIMNNYLHNNSRHNMMILILFVKHNNLIIIF